MKDSKRPLNNPNMPAPGMNAPHGRTDTGTGYAKGGLFIQKAIKHPGALHAELGVPQGQKIPQGKLQAAAKAGGVEGRRARFAETLEKLHH